MATVVGNLFNCSKCEASSKKDYIAVGFCYKCSYLCERCFSLHQQEEGGKRHKVMHVTSNSRTCSLYKEEMLVFYCERHDFVFCRICKLDRHKGCHAKKICKQVNVQGQKKYQATLEELNRLLHDIELAADREREVITRVTSDKNSATARLKNIFDNAEKDVKRIQQATQKDLENLQQSMVHISEQNNQTLMTDMAKVKRCSDCLKDTSGKNATDRFIEKVVGETVLKETGVRLHAIRREVPSVCTVQFAPNLDIVDFLEEKKSFGELETEVDKKEKKLH